jgi:hypothetical protein
MTAWGLPHSDIAGSSLLSSSPTLFAALHVLHRLWNQGIHLHALIKFFLTFNYVLITQNCTTGHGLSDGRSHVCFVTHESSSLYSFQGTRHRRFCCSRPVLLRYLGRENKTGNGLSKTSSPAVERAKRRTDARFVPSKLNSAVVRGAPKLPALRSR